MDELLGELSELESRLSRMEEKLSSLKKTRDRLCGIIAETTGKTVKQIMKKTRKDSFFTAEEALEYGLATELAERI